MQLGSAIARAQRAARRYNRTNKTRCRTRRLKMKRNRLMVNMYTAINNMVQIALRKRGVK